MYFDHETTMFGDNLNPLLNFLRQVLSIPGSPNGVAICLCRRRGWSSTLQELETTLALERRKEKTKTGILRIHVLDPDQWFRVWRNLYYAGAFWGSSKWRHFWGVEILRSGGFCRFFVSVGFSENSSRHVAKVVASFEHVWKLLREFPSWNPQNQQSGGLNKMLRMLRFPGIFRFLGIFAGDDHHLSLPILRIGFATNPSPTIPLRDFKYKTWDWICSEVATFNP